MTRFSRFIKMTSKEALEHLQHKTVLVLGLGGVGGYVVEALARSGIGHLILVDYDTVEESNINRQIIALTSTLGKKKTEILKQRVHEINPDCIVTCYDLFYQEENKDVIFQNSIDYIVDACDTIQSKKLIILECLHRKIPFISCMGTGNRLDPSKLCIEELRKTEGDPLARILRKWANDSKIKEKIWVLSSHELPIKVSSRTPGSSAFVPSSAGILIASHLVREMIDVKK